MDELGEFEVVGFEEFGDAVGVVGDRAVVTGDVVEPTSGFGCGMTGAADVEDVFERHEFDRVVASGIAGAEKGFEIIVLGFGLGRLVGGFLGWGGRRRESRILHPFDLVLDIFGFDFAVAAECAHAGDHVAKFTEVAAPSRGFGEGVVHEESTGFFGDHDAAIGVVPEEAQFVVEIRLDVVPTLGETGNAVTPAVDALKEIVAEAFGIGEILIRSANELKVTLHRLVRTCPSQRLFAARWAYFVLSVI